MEKYNFDSHISDDDGMFQVHCAAKTGDLELFQYLIEKGCDVYRQKMTGMNCLHISASNGHLRLCKMLLRNYRINLHMTYNNECSVLLCAAETGHLELFQYLVKKGCKLYS